MCIYVSNCDMDADILRAILDSYENDSKKDSRSENHNDISREILLHPQSEELLNTLCTSLSNLLCYKVSKEAYQRYSARLLVIDILRKWSKTTNYFDHLWLFMSEENTLKFVANLLDKYLTDDILHNCHSDDVLMSLTTAVIHLSIKNSSFRHLIDRLLTRLSQLEANDKIESLLYHALYMNPHLELSTKEEIYVSQRSKFIEEPLLDSFVRGFDPNEENRVNDQDSEETLNRLLEIAAESSLVFHWTFSFLKEMLIQLEYAPAMINFISSILKRVTVFCENKGRDMLDLYPMKLRSCVIILRIKPAHHTPQTKQYTLQTMKQIFVKSKDALLILLSHFPEWLELFAAYVNDEQS